MKTTFFLLSLLILNLILVGCGSVAPSKPASSAQDQASVDDIQLLLARAEQSRSPLREQQLLRASELLLEQQQFELVEQVLAGIDTNELSPSSLASFLEIKIRLYVASSDYQSAKILVDSPDLQGVIDDLPLEQQLRLNQLRAKVFALVGSHLASAQQRIFIDPLLNPDQQTENREAIWRSLMFIPTAELETYASTGFSNEYRGWLELAIIAKNNQADLDEQLRLLEDWQQRRANHPAAVSLPGGLDIIKELAANKPRKIALMVPVTGKLAPFGKAIREGFIAAMYQSRSRNAQVPELKVYNSASADFINVYQQAVTDGAELIVGPLDKSRVRLLFDEDVPVPTLALNRVDDYGQAPNNLYQFGLSPQDEAKQIAKIAALDNNQTAMIIAPKGEWGENVAATFATEWENLGGKIMDQRFFTGQVDYSIAIKDGLLIPDSETRSRRIQSLAGERIEYTPRRRQDIDMVFLLARPQQARSIKPLLAFHYASDIPVYATSRIYAGTPQPQLDRDINGIRFTDMPWVLQTQSPLRDLINNELSQTDQYQRMYALGIDSYQLHPRLKQLEVITQSRVYGETGNLKLNERREIEREMLLAKIRSGRPTVIPVADLTSTDNLEAKDGPFVYKSRKKEDQTSQ